MVELWNFAYGGNMNPDVLSGRRRIHPLETIPGVLHGYRLAFNLPGIPYIDPVFANIVPAEGQSVHGVLYRLSPEQFAKLDRFEGHGLAYRHLDVEVQAYGGRTIRARIYSAILTSGEGLPSKRYLDLLRQGARHHRLDLAYVRQLESHPCLESIRVPQALILVFERLLESGPRGTALIRALGRLRR